MLHKKFYYLKREKILKTDCEFQNYRIYLQLNLKIKRRNENTSLVA